MMGELGGGVAGAGGAGVGRQTVAGVRPVSAQFAFGAASAGGGDAAISPPISRLDVGESLFLAGLNAFPYGHFHEAHVKERCTAPLYKERLDYSRQALSFLADLMPPDWAGTITTVPGAWQADWTTPVDEEQALANLCRAGEHCRSIFTETGRKVRVAIEPEPGCAWKLFDPRVEQAANEICWCLDTCHAAVEFLH